MNFSEARDIETIWKSRELLAVACQLVKAGLTQFDAGNDFFGPDDIPEIFTAGGQGLTGSAVHMLRSAGIIEDYYGSYPEQGLMHGRRKSKRQSANGRKVCTYQIVGRGLAESFLKRNGQAMEPMQREMVLA
jgi:hypothetical protein